MHTQLEQQQKPLLENVQMDAKEKSPYLKADMKCSTLLQSSTLLMAQQHTNASSMVSKRAWGGAAGLSIAVMIMMGTNSAMSTASIRFQQEEMAV